MADGKAAVGQDEFQSRLVAFLPRLRRFCHGLAGDRDRGDDLLQTVVGRALERREQWEPGTSLENWIFRMTRNLHIDHYRASKARGVALGLDEVSDLHGQDAVAQLETRSELNAVRTALAAMPDDLREVMTVVIIDGQPYKDAATLLEIPIGTVMSRLSRARRYVHAFVADRGGKVVGAC